MDILVISDEPALADTLASELPELAFLSVSADKAAAALQTYAFRLVIADENAGAPEAFSALKTPLLRLVRPVRLGDLLYTIQSRLQSKSAPVRPSMAFIPGFVLSPAERHIRAEEGETRIALTEKELDLLLALLDNKNEPLTRELLLKQVWGYDRETDTHTVETHMYRLRGKLRHLGDTIDITFSEEGGYRMVLPPAGS